jgi:hypothetical protein
MQVVIFFLLFISSSLFACPDLSGEYLECRPTTGHSTGSRDMVVTQSSHDGVTTYVASATNSQTNEQETASYKADGLLKVEEVTDPENGNRIQISSVISCLNEKLSIFATVTTNGKETGFSKAQVYKLGPKLIIESHSRDGDNEGSDKEICE